MATAESGLTDAKRRDWLTIFNWVATLVACGYFIVNGVALYSSIPAFANMFASMSVELPASARLVLGFYRLLLPALFGGLTALVFAKEFFVRDRWARLAFTLAAVLAVTIASNAIVMALYKPIFALTEKLSK